MFIFSLLGIILVATIVSMLVGMVWYHSKVFGTIWQQNTQTVFDKKAQWKSIVYGFLSEYLLTGGLLLAIAFTGINPIFVAIAIWLTIIVPTSLDSLIYEKKNKKIFFIGISHRLVAIVLSSLVFMFL